MLKQYSLREINLEDKDAYLKYIESWNQEVRIVPFSSGLRGRTFEAFLSDLERSKKGLIEPLKFVPDQTFILVDEFNHIYGALNLRFYLTKGLFETGGHIGYGIGPKFRGLGLGNLILKLGLEKAKEIGLQSVLITAVKENEHSNKIIINNGGVYENSIQFEGSTYLRYWISLMAV